MAQATQSIAHSAAHHLPSLFSRRAARVEHWRNRCERAKVYWLEAPTPARTQVWRSAVRKLRRACLDLEAIQSQDDQERAKDFAALTEAAERPHVAVIWRGDDVVFLEEHPTEREAGTAMICALLAMDAMDGVRAYTQPA